MTLGLLTQRPASFIPNVDNPVLFITGELRLGLKLDTGLAKSRGYVGKEDCGRSCLEYVLN